MTRLPNTCRLCGKPTEKRLQTHCNNCFKHKKARLDADIASRRTRRRAKGSAQ